MFFMALLQIYIFLFIIFIGLTINFKTDLQGRRNLVFPPSFSLSLAVSGCSEASFGVGLDWTVLYAPCRCKPLEQNML